MLRLTVALLATAMIIPAAQAADLPPPPPPPVPAAWSFSVFGGASWLNDFDAGDDFGSTLDFSYDTGFLVGGTLGYTFVDWARTELEIAYAGYDLDSLSEDGGFPIGNNGGDLGVLTVMGNLWLGFNMLPVVGDPVNSVGAGLGFSPYFGGGLGVGFVNGSIDGLLSDWDGDDTGLAWQVGAGVRWNFASNLGLDIGYRYRNVTSVSAFDNVGSFDLSSNNVVVGLTFNF